MEKRFLLAFLLSFSVLFLWSALFPPPKPAHKPQPVVNNEDINDSRPVVDQALSSPPSPLPTVQEIPVETKRLENDKLIAEISSQGGSLQQVIIKDYGAQLPVSDIMAIAGYENAHFRVSEFTDEAISLVYEDQDIRITKEYFLADSGYLMEARIKWRNLREMSNLKEIKAFTLDISRLDKSSKAEQEKRLFEYAVISSGKTFRKENASKFHSNEQRDLTGVDPILGFRDRYFCIGIKPEFKTDKIQVIPVNEEVLTLSMHINESDVPREAGIGAKIFFGPQKYDLMKSYELGFEQLMVFSSWRWLDAISKAINSMINLSYKFIPNWGVAIILVSLLIYLALYPLTLSGMSSMKKIQFLQPKINALREQYKANPQRLNKEIMELYKENKVNPFGGCLPLFLQMPIFFGLYQVLWRSVSFKGAHFLWIKDLSEPDRLVVFSSSLPLVGNELNILPILMMVIMFVQQKLSTKNMVTTDPSQAAQQKMMVMIMPPMMGILFYKFASGLTLYFTIFYLMSTLTQFKMSKMTKAS
ncbi:MAG: YidC/Oxa1 family insertase periplasmic-domain containing protein [Candidatus Omnitrophota bacterium]|nr:YidC/Oxa1 family insertase periplasmic-domain containing protein [Candidatus Omnitrophota bacterium]